MNLTSIAPYLKFRMNGDEKGVTTVEYAVMVIVIGVTILLAGTVLPNAIVTVFSSVATQLTTS